MIEISGSSVGEKGAQIDNRLALKMVVMVVIAKRERRRERKVQGRRSSEAHKRRDESSREGFSCYT